MQTEEVELLGYSSVSLCDLQLLYDNQDSCMGE